MSLPPFTDHRHAAQRACAVTLLIAVLLTGCAGGGKPKSNAGDAAERDANGQPVAAAPVPPAAQTMYEQAVAVMSGGDYLEAQLRFQEFLLQYPEFPGAHVNLAIIYSNTGDEAAAENSLTDALIIDPQHPAALNQLGMLLRRQGKFPEAQNAYLRAVEADPEYAIAHYNLGVLNDLYVQDLEAALQHYERYEKLHGEDKQVQKWIKDLKRRIEASQRTANVTE